MMGNVSLIFLTYTSIITLISYINWHCHAAVVSNVSSSAITVDVARGDKFYGIQNANYNAYLKAINNSKLCEKLGDVFTSRYEDQHSTAYRWKPEKGGFGGVRLDVENRDYRINEFTMEDNPPNCYPSYAEYELVEEHHATYRIKTFRNKKCLTGHGIGKRISFEECQNVWNQLWYFIDLDNKKLYEEERK